MTGKAGLKIKQQRKARGLTQSQLVEKLHKGGSAVKMWEIGRSYPDAETLIAIAKLFGVTTDYLLGADIAIDEINSAEVPEPTPQENQINKELPRLN